MLSTEQIGSVSGIVVLVLGITLVLWLMYNNKRRKSKSSTQAASRHCKQVISRGNHPVSRKKISDNALKVVNRLNSQGYEAYLVGGCVRDIYLDLNPKDFDVVTSATPEEVRRSFRNSRLIGRRFKLVHVLFGREMIEVATFRASHDAEKSPEQSRHSESGRILRDNVYGTMEDDAIRRDFTINALYYDARDFSVVDFCNGIEDINARTLRLIGDPVTRYHEDPVRMLRAIRFAAKLGFDIAPEADLPIRELGHLLKDIPSARLFDEVLKLLQSGQGVESFHLLREYGLFEALFPATERCLQEGDRTTEQLILNSLRSTDKRIARNRPVTPAFLFAALLWDPMRKLAQDFCDQGIPPVPALQQAAMTVLDNQVAHTAIPKRFSIMVREIWDFQGRLERRQPRAIESLLEHPRFRAAYDFLLLREQAGEALNDVGQWWTDIQESDEQERLFLVKDLRNPRQARKAGEQKKSGNKRRRRRRKPSGSSRDQSSSGQSSSGGVES